MKLKNIAKIQPNIVDFIYNELALDRSSANHPDMQQRLRLIFLGEQGLIPDLRHLYPSRPSYKFDTFLKCWEKWWKKSQLLMIRNMDLLIWHN